MRKLAFTLAALLLIGGSVMAGSFRVHYSIRGSGRDITVQAESSARSSPRGHEHVSRRDGDRRQSREVAFPLLRCKDVVPRSHPPKCG
jgi:hypothetical protein